MSKKKVVSIEDARKAREDRKYDELEDMLEYIGWVSQLSLGTLRSMRDEAREAANAAGLNFSNFSLREDAAHLYYYSIFDKLMGDVVNDADWKDAKDDEEREELLAIRDMQENPILLWDFESKNGTYYTLIVDCKDCENDPKCCELSSSLHVTSPDGKEREYNFLDNVWEDLEDAEDET